MKVKIVVPVYKDSLNEFEYISLSQLNRVLPEFKKCFVKPKGLKLRYINEFKFEEIEFPQVNFESTEAYSRLLLTTDFYEKFSDCDYILIYQTDAFVFKDELIKFCSMNYDYIGAPLPVLERWVICNSGIGNGGLSLRRVSKFIEILKNYKQILNHSNYSEYFFKYEDLFWGYCGGNDKIPFKVPSLKVASQFSTERDINKMISKSDEKGLPFGTHEWTKVNYDHWKSIIESYGYYLPDECSVNFINTVDLDSLYSIEIHMIHAIKRFKKDRCRYKSHIFERLINDFKSIFKVSDQVYIWGGGLRCRDCIEYLKIFNVETIGVIDKKYTYGEYSGEAPIESYFNDKKKYKTIPVDEEVLKNIQNTIIISSYRFGNEIANYLESLGLENRKDFYLIDDLRKQAAEMYICSVRNLTEQRDFSTKNRV